MFFSNFVAVSENLDFTSIPLMTDISYFVYFWSSTHSCMFWAKIKFLCSWEVFKTYFHDYICSTNLFGCFTFPYSLTTLYSQFILSLPPKQFLSQTKNELAIIWCITSFSNQNSDWNCMKKNLGKTTEVICFCKQKNFVFICM